MPFFFYKKSSHFHSLESSKSIITSCSTSFGYSNVRNGANYYVIAPRSSCRLAVAYFCLSFSFFVFSFLCYFLFVDVFVLVSFFLVLFSMFHLYFISKKSTLYFLINFQFTFLRACSLQHKTDEQMNSDTWE